MHINIVVHSDSEHSRPEELKSHPPPPPPLFTPSLAKERLDVALLVVLILTTVPTTAVGVESVQAMSHPIFGASWGRCTFTLRIYSLTRRLKSDQLSCAYHFRPSYARLTSAKLWIIFELIFAYSAFAAASLLIVLRIFAIWDGNKTAVSIAMSAWLTNFAFLVHDITELRATWVPVPGVCAVLNIESSKNTVILTLVTDVILCLTMLVGLLRLRQNGTTMVALWNFLWRQGLIWVFLATVVQIVPTVFISLNLNDPFDLMFQTPSFIVMSIAATRMYRSLTDFTSTSGLLDSTQTRSGRTTTSEPKRISTAPIPLDRIGMEVAVHRSYEEDYPPVHADRYSSYVSTDSHSQDKPPALDADNDLENGVKA
ncbi:hypothetical protein EDB85DRAFT_2157971 [Lactarius pseudohatsudake]|nr:hypothetical protein EDB85DRAFT_2157971 [Lactarius pseudohatsudake]